MKKYYFVFCKEDLLLELTPDGNYTIPLQEEPPTEVKPWTNMLNITPMADGTPVVTYRVDTPTLTSQRLRVGATAGIPSPIICHVVAMMRLSYQSGSVSPP